MEITALEGMFPRIGKLARRYAKENGRDTEEDLDFAFKWSETSEGFNFWQEIYYEHFSTAKKRIPELFMEEENLPYKIQVNGLLK